LVNKGNKKRKKGLPTVEEILRWIPTRNPILEWSTNTEDLVEIKVPKFKSNIGKSFCKLLKKEETFIAKMDKIGSLVWRHSDGAKTVKDILEILKKKYPLEKDIDQRLFLFIQQMHSLDYIILK